MPTCSPSSSAKRAGGEDRERRAGPHLEPRADRGMYPPADTHHTASLREGRRRLFAASHPPAVCRDGRVVVDAARHGRRGTMEDQRGRKRQAGGVCRGSHDDVPHLRLSSSMAQTPFPLRTWRAKPTVTEAYTRPRPQGHAYDIMRADRASLNTGELA